MIEHVSSGRTVPLNKLVLSAPIIGTEESWQNPREFSGLEASEIESLGKRIKANGITQALIVQQVRDDKGQIVNLILDGQRRFLAAKEAFSKDAEIPVQDADVEVLDLTSEVADQLTMKALTSLDREDLTSYELVTVAARYSGKKTLDAIGALIGKDSSWVSKMLKARKHASDKLLTRWKAGDVTDEQFKELAALEGADQETATEDVVKARKSGDKAEARVLSKEHKEKAIAAKAKTAAPAPSSSKTKHQPALQPREQTDMFAPKVDKAREVKPPSKIVLDQFLALSDKKPPTADTVKGIFLGVRYAMGLVTPAAFGKAFDQYVARLDGKPRPAKKAKAKPAKKARPAKKSRRR